MNFVPCLTWLPKGVAKETPEKLQLSPEEIKSLLEESKQNYKNFIEEENANGGSDEEMEVEDTKQVEDKTKAESDEDINELYNLDSYDNDEADDNPINNMAAFAVFTDNKEDNYITNPEEGEQDELDEKEDFSLKPSDNLLVVGRVDDESSVMEIYVYNKEDEAFYVHHDIVLTAYPLCLEWLDFHPADDTPGNYIAVGDMTPEIKIFDLDIVDVLEPDYVLGKMKKKAKKSSAEKGHTDAVISLSWNKYERNTLASGSADTTIGLWDLQTAKLKNKMTHKGKVQSLQWHPSEAHSLVSGCSKGIVKLFDVRCPVSELQKWKVNGEVERVVWNTTDSSTFFCSTDDGFVYCIDRTKNDVLYQFKAHSEAVTGLDVHSNLLLTASMDKSIKIWKLGMGGQVVNAQKLKVGSIYTGKFCPHLDFTLAVGGNRESNNLKVLDLMEQTEFAEAVQNMKNTPVENNLLNTASSSSSGVKNKRIKY